MRRALRLVRSAAPVAALLLSACGGGGGGGVNFVPAPPVTPSPTPSPPYDSFPLNKSASFDTIIAERWVDRSFAPNLNAFDVAARPSGFTISYDASSGSYTVNGEGFVQTFTDAERSSSGYFDTYTDPAHPDVHLTLLNNTRVDPSVSGAPVQLSYLSFGRETLDQTLDGGGAGWHWDTYFLFGYPTQTSDMPKTGTASYSTAAFASYTTLNKGDPITTVTGNATFSADFASGTVSTALTLPFSHDTSTSSTYNGSGTVADNQFSGQFTTSDDPFFGGGNFDGGFFGPAAKEMGYTFTLQRAGGDNGSGIYVIGAVVGTKK